MHSFRSHSCNELTLKNDGEQVRLSGWLHRKRDHGGLLFLDLRDHYGITQCVLEPEDECFNLACDIPPESVVRVNGRVVKRDADTVNKDIPTGEVEVRVENLDILSRAETLPLPVFGEPPFPEDIRLQYRFLDLRRASMHRNIVLRSKIISSIRERMTRAGFLEYQTPILTASSPEGARDFLVPSRLHPGKFYALPQAPQQFKQLTMIAGFDRYFQIAPCFRDEDARADRSPGEFYQLDIEMSFVEQQDVFDALEPVLLGLFEEFADGREVRKTFPKIPYREALAKYGSDKPDLRNPIEIVEVGKCFMQEGVEFRAFRSVVEFGGVVRGIPAPNAAKQPRAFFDRIDKWARDEMGAKGLGYIIFEAGEGGSLVGKGPIAKFLTDEALKKISSLARIGAGDAIFFACNTEAEASILAGAARERIGHDLGLIDDNVFAFCWIVNYPFYERSETDGHIVFSHNPFSMPQGGLEALKGDPLSVLAYQYDVVCNGVELSSGAIRNHDVNIMYKAFEIAGYGREQVEKQFGGMLRALQYGVPPHGGIAPGLDRIVMLLAGVENLREVTMFPMNQRGEDLLMGAPCEVDDEQIKILHLRQKPRPKT